MPNPLKGNEDEAKVDFLEAPSSSGQEGSQFSAAAQKDKFLGGGGRVETPQFCRSKKKADGTLDLSRAASMSTEESQRLGLARQKLAAEQQRARQEKLAIPQGVKKDSATQVWYELRNVAMLAQEKIAQTDPAHTQREQEQLSRFRLEQTIIDDMTEEYRESLLESSQRQGRSLSWEQGRAQAQDYSAVAALGHLEGNVEKWQQALDKNPDATVWVRQSSQSVRVADVLRAATDLQNRLARAATSS